MNKEREFDMLENADEKTVELLAEIPVLTKEEKERMLVMSKKKLDMMKRENNITFNSGEDQVSGVERYSRPKWRRFAAMAACLALVGGIAGTVFVIGKSGKKSDKDTTPMATVTTDGTETPTSPAQTSTLIGEGEREIPYLTDAELLEVAKKGMENFNMFQSMAYGYGVKVDENDKFAFGVPDDNGKLHDYFRVTDERFSTKEELYSFAEGYFAGQLLDLYKDPAFFTEKDGKLYYKYNGKDTISVVKYEGEPEISNYDGTGFAAVVPVNWNDEEKTLKLSFSCTDNKWYISAFDIIYAPTSDDAERMLGYLSRLEELSSCSGVYCDPDVKKEVKVSDEVTYIYCKVLDDPNATDFKNSLGDIQSWVEYVCTGDMLERYRNICFETEESKYPVFMEFDGELYQKLSGKGSLFDYCALPRIENVTSDSYDIVVLSREPGIIVKDLRVTVIRDGGIWKLSSYEFDESSAHEPTADEAEQIDRYTLSENAIYSIRHLQNIAGGGILTDTSDEKIVRATGAGVHYYRVIENGGSQSIQDFIREIDTFSAGAFHDELMQKINGDVPMYQEIDGKLYCCQNGSYWNYNDIRYVDSTLNSSTGEFTVKANLTDSGEPKTMIIKGKKDTDTGTLQITEYTITDRFAN